MDRDSFGSQSTKRGVKVPTQNEWNELNNSLTNVTFGENGFTVSDVDKYGSNIPTDACFFPHVAQVDYGNTDAIIGPDREEDWYPFVDTISAYTLTQIDTFDLSGSSYAFNGITSSDASSTSVLFDTASTITPEKPADNSNAGIVGYGWDLEALVTNVVFSDSSDQMTVTTKWQPGSVFDDDSQAAMYTVDSSSTGAWGASNIKSTNSTEYEDLINDWLIDAAQDQITLKESSNIDIYDREVNIPVAAYTWGVGQTSIARCVQLLFGNASPPGGNSSSIPSSSSDLKDSPSGQIETPSEKTYTLELSVPTSGDITGIKTSCVSGSGEAQVKIGGVAVNFYESGSTDASTTIDFSSTADIQYYPVVESPSTADFSAGDKLDLVITDILIPPATTLLDAKFTLGMTRGIQ